jgi:membrane protein required for colicin V production
MNGFDMLVVVVLGYCIIRGVFKGFIREVSSIVGVLGGFYAAYAHHRSVAPFFAGWISDPVYREIAGFVVLFCGVFLAVLLIGALIRFLLRMALLGVLDRIFGAVFGVLKGVILVSLLFFFLVRFLPPKGVAVVQGSKLSPFVNTVSKDIARLVPPDIRDRFIKRLDDLEKEPSAEPL